MKQNDIPVHSLISVIDGIYLSRHAEKRMQQRGIPPWLLDLAIHCGAGFYSRGARVFHFHNKRAWRVAERKIRAMELAEDNHLRDAYFVEKSGLVLTASWMDKSIRRQTQRRKKYRGQS